MNKESRWIRFAYILGAPVILTIVTLSQYSQGNTWSTLMTATTGVYTLPLVYRFWRELRMDQEIEDERFIQVGKKAGSISFVAVSISAIVTGGIGAILRTGNEAYSGFVTTYDTAIVALVGAISFTALSIFYDQVGVEKKITDLLKGDS